MLVHHWAVMRVCTDINRPYSSFLGSGNSFLSDVVPPRLNWLEPANFQNTVIANVIANASTIVIGVKM